MAASSSTGLGGSIRFPALWSHQNTVYAINSLDDVSQCTKAGFKSGCYNGAVVIDSDCRKFEVTDARKLRTLFRFTIGELIGVLTGNPRWQVEFTFAPTPAKSSFNEVRRLVLNSFEKEKDGWEAMVDFEEFQDKIAATASVAELFAVFREFNMA